MNDHQIAIVQSTFEQLVPHTAELSSQFYGRLFEVTPYIRILFPANLTHQKEKLISTLALAIRGLNQPEEIKGMVQALGLRHVSYGVKPHHYDLVGEALLWTLKQQLGHQFTAEVAEAWTTAYTLLANPMQQGAQTVLFRIHS